MYSVILTAMLATAVDTPQAVRAAAGCNGFAKSYAGYAVQAAPAGGCSSFAATGYRTAPIRSIWANHLDRVAGRRSARAERAAVRSSAAHSRFAVSPAVAVVAASVPVVSAPATAPAPAVPTVPKQEFKVVPAVPVPVARTPIRTAVWGIVGHRCTPNGCVAIYGWK